MNEGIEFVEYESGTDGWILVTWYSGDKHLWRIALNLFKSRIPRTYRFWDAKAKLWGLDLRYIEMYEALKIALIEGDNAYYADIEYALRLDDAIKDMRGFFGSFDDNIARVILEAVANGEDIEYSLSRECYALYIQHEESWVYSDGFRSTISPQEYDKQKEVSALENLSRIVGKLGKPIYYDNPIIDAEMLLPEPETLFHLTQSRKDIQEVREFQLEIYVYTCYLCGAKPAEHSNLSLVKTADDNGNPRSKDEYKTVDNTIIVCRSCSSRVSKMTHLECDVEHHLIGKL